MGIPKILLVEDNPADVDLLHFGFDESKIECDISVATDGIYAKEFLNKEGEFADAFTPEIIVLDIGLPRLSGIQVLAYIKNHETFKKIPVTMLTSSSLQSDMQLCQEHNADAYMLKAAAIDKYPEIAVAIYELWKTFQSKNDAPESGIY